jgi:hypothetical protein
MSQPGFLPVIMAVLPKRRLVPFRGADFFSPPP